MKKYQIVLLVLTLLATFILFPIVLHTALLQRGYKAFGGEWLILVLALVLVFVIRDLPDDLKTIKKAFKKNNEHVCPVCKKDYLMNMGKKYCYCNLRHGIYDATIALFKKDNLFI